MKKRKVKILAFYLPQYHIIPENNVWWGEGFTDWMNVKKARPLFGNHRQPRIPQNQNYYDLMNSDVMKWQSILAQDNGVYGFCYYHYWFNGKLLLERPLENMLNNKDVKIPFCLSWANEPWARTWDGKDTDVLMPQHYGSEKEWNLHFNYLLRFFKDERYIKENNKPLFVIYKTMHIPNIEEMCNYWNSLALVNGFNGLFFVETLGGVQSLPSLKCSEAVIEFEPNYTIAVDPRKTLQVIKHRIMRKMNKGLAIYSYDCVWRNILKRDINRFTKKIFLGGFVDWDNTPRKGMRGIIFKGSSPDKFRHFIKKQIQRSSTNNYIFINAWNEWAEGAYLEPDDTHGLAYLHAIKSAVMNSMEE